MQEQKPEEQTETGRQNVLSFFFFDISNISFKIPYHFFEVKFHTIFSYMHRKFYPKA